MIPFLLVAILLAVLFPVFMRNTLGAILTVSCVLFMIVVLHGIITEPIGSAAAPQTDAVDQAKIDADLEANDQPVVITTDFGSCVTARGLASGLMAAFPSVAVRLARGMSAQEIIAVERQNIVVVETPPDHPEWIKNTAALDCYNNVLIARWQANIRCLTVGGPCARAAKITEAPTGFQWGDALPPAPAAPPQYIAGTATQKAEKNLTLPATPPAAEGRVGPGFDCAKATAPLARMICANAELSKTDLRFNQAYYALRQKLDPAGRHQLQQEDLEFLDLVLRFCGIPESGPVAGSPDCVAARYDVKRSEWLARLTGPAREEASRSIERHVDLQRRLQQLSFLPATTKIDGVYNSPTRAAIVAWQNANGRPETGFMGDADAEALGR